MTADIKKGWLNLARRLQSVCKTEGYAIVKVTAVVDCNGNPVQWIEPTVRKFEPKGIDLEKIVQDIGEEEFGKFMDVLSEIAP